MPTVSRATMIAAISRRREVEIFMALACTHRGSKIVAPDGPHVFFSHWRRRTRSDPMISVEFESATITRDEDKETPCCMTDTTLAAMPSNHNNQQNCPLL